MEFIKTVVFSPLQIFINSSSPANVECNREVKRTRYFDSHVEKKKIQRVRKRRRRNQQFQRKTQDMLEAINSKLEMRSQY